ncbi:unnamed protein product [Prunus armeniaca]
MEEIKSKLEEASGLPNCCGAIDGTHIIMTIPTVQTSDDCCDLEDNYNMLFLQGIVDHEMRFLDIVTGWPGGMTNFIWRSRDYRILSWWVGYPLLPWLITPYESNGPPSFHFCFQCRAWGCKVSCGNGILPIKGHLENP